MAFYRSELEVPVNKTTSQLRDRNETADTSKNRTEMTNSQLDNWSEKVKLNLHNNRDSFNSIRDNLLQNDFINPSLIMYPNRDVDCFKPLEMFQQLQSKIAKGFDGNMHFTASFDVKDVNPDNVKVFVKEGSVVITVEQKEVLSAKSTSSREYTRKFNLPPNIIVDTIVCTLSSDNILSLDGVLEYSKASHCNSNPQMTSSLSRDDNSSRSLGSTSFLQSRPEQKYKINVTVGSGYDPHEIDIKTRDDKLFINARHEEKSESRTNYREFSKELTLPYNVDSLSLSAIFNNGILYLEAPYIDR